MDFFTLEDFFDTSCNVAIETGTYLGETTERLSKRSNFICIHSIELSQPLSVKAKILFKDTSWVTIWHGDSSYYLPIILDQIKQTITYPKVFIILDAHYSGGFTATLEETASPLLQELYALKPYGEIIKTIIIDDINVCYDISKKTIERNEYTVGWPKIEDVIEVLLDINKNFKITHFKNRRLYGLLRATL